jgi:hypothetical protein
MKPEDSHCSICFELSDCQKAYQKFGSEENDTQLPSAFSQLELVKDLRPFGSRELKVMQCPGCGAWFLYETDYEYLINGSEDEQTLTRLSVEEAEKRLNLPEQS